MEPLLFNSTLSLRTIGTNVPAAHVPGEISKIMMIFKKILQREHYYDDLLPLGSSHLANASSFISHLLNAKSP